ncbi:MAG: PKD domain-containing protein [Flavobacteriales bacterium]|jgi:gliding motility-associated-like protein|nr:PKD domain-containing protein [Flavobacteriales bacterium]
MKRLFSILIILFGLQGISHASHIVGGEIYYDCLGGNTYRITVKVYRDCFSDGADFDTNLPITVFNGSNAQIDQFTIPFPGKTTLDPVFSNPCVTIPPDICVEEAVYTIVRDLPASSNGYTLSYQRCCRGPAVTNLLDPEDTGLTLTTSIPPPSDAICNSSPRFSNYPPLLLCSNQELVFDHSATDPDGDVIVYELCDPFHGGTSFDPAPSPASPPPYTTVTWAAGASTTNPFIMGGITINPTTGLLTATPEMNGLFAVGVCAREYRDGVLISTTVRDFLFRVFNCEITMEATVVPQVELSTFVSYCQGLTIDFENASYGGTNYEWDFGVPGTTDDISSDFAPTYTFPSPGTYDVTLIVNPGWPCTDTSTETFIINDNIEATYNPPEAQCIVNNSFDFFADGDYPTIAEGTTFEWNFGDDAIPATSTDEDPTDITFTDSGWQPVTFTVFYDICEVSYTDSVFVYAEPTIDFTIADELRCAPYDAQFIDLSFAHTPINYSWNFGDGTELSNLSDPLHTYENPGLYDVELTIWTTSGCIDTLTLLKEDLIEVFPSPISQFTVAPPESDVFHPHFDFTDQSIDSDQHFYFFDDKFGSSTEERIVSHSYIESGYHYPYQVVINQYGCTDTSWQTIYIIPYTTIYIPNAFTPNAGNLNSFWRPQVYDTEAYQLYIYNRWGELILYSEDENAYWDGTTPSGALAPDDVYVYKIWWIDITTGLQNEKYGHVTLIR